MLKFDLDNYPPTHPEHVELTELGQTLITEITPGQNYDDRLRSYGQAIGAMMVAAIPQERLENDDEGDYPQYLLNNVFNQIYEIFRNNSGHIQTFSMGVHSAVEKAEELRSTERILASKI